MLSLRNARLASCSFAAESERFSTSRELLKLLGYDYGQPVAPMPHLDDRQMAKLTDELHKVIGPGPMSEGRLIESRDLASSSPAEAVRI